MWVSSATQRSTHSDPSPVLCDPVQHNYRQWECSVHGLFSVSGRNSSAANSSATTLLPTTFEQHFDMGFLKTGGQTVLYVPHWSIILLLCMVPSLLAIWRWC